MAEHRGAVGLSFRRPPLVAVHRAVHATQVFANTLLAGDGSALLGGHNARAQCVCLGGVVRQFGLQRVFGIQSSGASVGRVTDASDGLHGPAHVPDGLTQLAHQRELSLAVFHGELGARVERHLQLAGVHLAVLGQLHRVGSGQYARSNAGLKQRRGRRWNLGRLQSHGPLHAVDATLHAWIQRVHQLALGVEDLDLEIALHVPGPLIVGDGGVLRPSGAVKRVVALTPPAVGLQILHRAARRQQRGLGRENLRSQRAQRRNVVNDPDAASMRCQHQVALALLDDDVAHGHGREVGALVLCPVIAAIHAHPQAQLGAQEEQLRILGVFGDDVRIAMHAALFCGQRLPGLAAVGGLVNVRRHVAKGVAIKRRVGHVRAVAAGGNGRYPAVLRQAGHVANDVRPGLAAVAGHLQVAVVGAGPNDEPALRRFADGVDRGVRLGRGVVNGHAAGLLLLLLLRIVCRQIRRDAIPGLPMIARAEQVLGANVDGAFLVRTHVNRRVPVQPQLLVSVVGVGMDAARLMRDAIDAPQFAAL